MDYTRHAHLRAQQRAISPLLVDLLLQFGHREKSGDGTAKMFFDKDARRKLRTYAGALARSIEQHLDVYVVVGPAQKVITVAHRDERIYRR